MIELGLIFILGLCFGSFLNVCIHRIPRGQSVAWPPSTCPHCNTRIKWFDNIPVFSWLLLRAQCRACKQSISAIYPGVELLTAIFFIALWRIYGASWLTPIYALAGFGLLLGTFVDLKYLILPDRVTLGGMILFPILSAFFPPLHGVVTWTDGFVASLVGLLPGVGLFWIIRRLGTAALKKEALGLGDVKLIGMLGALLGWQAVLYITFISALTGAFVGTGLIVMQKKELSSRIPYGPFIAFAAFSWILGGDRLWEAYLTLIGF